MVVITLLRGFKVPVEILDAFLTANGIPEEHEMLGSGIPPFYDTDSDKVTTLLRQKSQNNKTRVFMPYRQPFDRALTAYIAYDWIWVFAQRRIKSEEVTSTCSAAFEELRKEILSYDTPGTVDDDEFQNDVFIIVTDEQSYAPPLWDRYYNLRCDQCEATFDDGHWYDRQQHRISVHGSREGRNPLPDNA